MRADRVFASRQAITLEGLIAKADAALDVFRHGRLLDRYSMIQADVAMCLDQAMATIRAMPEPPPIVRVTP